MQNSKWNNPPNAQSGVQFKNGYCSSMYIDPRGSLDEWLVESSLPPLPLFIQPPWAGYDWLHAHTGKQYKASKV